ncbi:MAG: exopolysaccharide biosynthesis polyprenyl glycosylphosphotransferase [Candidatus Eisenbacteria bacterium]|uniref:Exopolysaccharide biosynthesis polyprenyl glycosylphosphotransferase n=1 Tax=Eiseniibacteriota bacterium TaxID=2212470 RepID=A0A933SBD1_UNCEI|nr:exopolysaccharide biosynthesis polyprenyl glycosylphosphotransferase [Candidatus Eisenbacteria bacterium]
MRAPIWSKPVNGSGHATPHPAGFANGHARPRVGTHASSHGPRAASLAASVAPVIPFETPAAEGFYLRFGKRALDITGALVALILAAPIVAIIAALIRLESRGPVFYKSVRVGRGGRPFTFYKLRSMVKDADRKRHKIAHMNEADGPIFKIARDPRITRVGRFIRTTSLDEIPQFYNVLIGDMSLVGPRPPIPEEVAQYEPWQLRRLDVRPGITCLWQISGRSRIGFQEWMRLDLEYIKHQSFGLDLKILLRTIPAVLSREGAY